MAKAPTPKQLAVMDSLRALGLCANCSSSQRAMIYRNEFYCSDNCAKALGFKS